MWIKCICLSYSLIKCRCFSISGYYTSSLSVLTRVDACFQFANASKKNHTNIGKQSPCVKKSKTFQTKYYVYVNILK